MIIHVSAFFKCVTSIGGSWGIDIPVIYNILGDVLGDFTTYCIMVLIKCSQEYAYLL